MMVRGATELETHVVSVERVKEYCEVEQEVVAVKGHSIVNWTHKNTLQLNLNQNTFFHSTKYVWNCCLCGPFS